MKIQITVGALLLFAAAALLPSTASAHSYHPGESGHPFRLISYPTHAFGKFLERGTRKIHYCVSQPCNRNLYGHVSNPRVDNYWGDPDEYQRLSY